MKLHNPQSFEVVAASGSISGSGRKIVIVGCYIPPNYPVGRGKAALDFIAGVVAEAKRRFDDPLLIVGGDYNQWDIAGSLQDFPDLSEAPVGPTRGN